MNFKISKYIKPTNYFFKQSRSYQVIVAGIGSFCILMIILMIISILDESLRDELWKITGFWTLLTLIISSPVAFVIWRFRDENQSKDINLKEFQKIAEWVSGMHFPDNHVEITKTTTRTTKTPSNQLSAEELEISTEEKTAETTKKPENTDFFSKRSGAESLQIAAIYNLLPFYRGDHGSSFEKPAVNLLKSTWAMMQQDLLQQLKELAQDKTKTPEEIAEQQKQICKELRNHANSPLGQAITRVWMACDHNGQLLIHRHPEIFAGLCLSGMNFGLAGLEIDILREKLFTGRDEQGNSFDYWGIQLQAANLSKNKKIGFNFSGSLLNDADFLKAELWEANFSQTKLLRANFSQVILQEADFSQAELWEANFSRAELPGTNFSQAALWKANFSRAYLPKADFSQAELLEANFSRAPLLEADFSETFISEKNGITDYNLFIKNDVKLENTFIVIPSNTALQQALSQKKAIVAIPHSAITNNKILLTKMMTVYCKHKLTHTETKGKTTPIDLPQTQALNPDWEIKINVSSG